MKVRLRKSLAICSSLVMLLSIASASHAADDGWTVVASTDTMVWSAKNGSLYTTKNGSGAMVVAVIGRIADSATNTVRLTKWYVPVADCADGLGKVTTTDVSGNFQFDNDFVQGAGTVASGLADAICAAYAASVKESLSKSI